MQQLLEEPAVAPLSQMCCRALPWRRLTSEISVFRPPWKVFVQKSPADGFANAAELCFSKEKFKGDTPELVLSCVCQQRCSAEVTSYLVQAWLELEMLFIPVLQVEKLPHSVRAPGKYSSQWKNSYCYWCSLKFQRNTVFYPGQERISWWCFPLYFPRPWSCKTC